MGAKLPAGVLRKRGPLISSEIARALQQGGASAEAARKRLQRAIATGEVRSLDLLRLPNNQRLLYLQEQFGTPEYWSALRNALIETGSVYGHALASLEARGGSMPEALFGTMSGSPTKLRGHISHERVLSTLSAVRLVERLNDPQLGPLVNARAMETIEPARLRANLIAEHLMLSSAADWLKKNGLVSFNSVRLRPYLGDGDVPDFAHVPWDLSAPSFVHPLSTRSATKASPGFVVADVLLGDDIGVPELKYFMHKYDIIRAQRGLRPALLMLIASRFRPEALSFGRSRGVMLTTPGLLLGEEIARGLESLIMILTNAAKVAASHPDAIMELMAKLSRIEGAAGKLRGPLFEMIVAMCVLNHEGSSIDIGKRIIVPKTGEAAEIDVLRVKGEEEVWAYECKGRNTKNLVGIKEVSDWHQRQIGRIYAWINSEGRFARCKKGFAFWTASGFTDEALRYLKDARSSTQKFSLSWKSGNEVYEYAKVSKQVHAVKLLEEHYRGDPLPS